MTKIAVMQPYFIPYAGYFRLMQSADIFVVYDCVQFPRRGYVHRNKLNTLSLNTEWLSLPLIKQEQSIRIDQLLFRDSAGKTFFHNLKKKHVFEKIKNNSILMDLLNDFSSSPCIYIVNLLKYFSYLLNIKTQFIYSSSMSISNSFNGQDRIIEIANKLNATHYINSPNGRSLYSQNEFSKNNIKLQFLNEYQGNFISILDNYFSLTKEEREHFSQDLKTQSI